MIDDLLEVLSPSQFDLISDLVDLIDASVHCPMIDVQPISYRMTGVMNALHKTGMTDEQIYQACDDYEAQYYRTPA